MSDDEIFALAAEHIKWIDPRHALFYDDALLSFARALAATAPAPSDATFINEGDMLTAPLFSTRQAAKRFQWLQPRFIGYDFYWGEDQKVVAVFEVGEEFRGGRDIAAAIDAQINRA
jgi:hypothetical protein